MFKPIQIKSIEDVKEISEFATHFEFDTWVDDKLGRVNAKSILGLITMINKPDLYYVVPDGANPVTSFKGLEKFAV